MTTAQCVHWLDAVIAIARDAGRAILEIYEGGFDVEHKQDGSPLTLADQAANQLIVTRLEVLTPELPVLSEESATIAYSDRARWKRFWLVDPLDGTREFVKRNGEFTVNIALIEDGRAILGVVHVPVTGVTYSGCIGAGAWREERGGLRRAIGVRPCPARPVVVASRSHAGEALQAYLEQLGDHDTISMGSSLKLCLVAEGTADLYPRLGPTSEWDTAAAQAIVEAAGGRVTDINGAPLRYNKPDILNPWFLVSGAGDTDWTRGLHGSKPATT
jgi:3'(2'), 5'-bisphosphate nucleotidase